MAKRAEQQRGYLGGNNMPRYESQAAVLAAISALNEAGIAANEQAIRKAGSLTRGQVAGVLARVYYGRRGDARLVVANGDDGVDGIVWTLRASGESWLRWYRYISGDAC